MQKRLTLFIFLALALGGVAGTMLHYAIADATKLASIDAGLGVFTELFLRLVKMIIAPLVFGTLVSGIAHMGDQSALGRIALRTMLWFVCASIASLTLGLIIVNILQPGSGIAAGLPSSLATSGTAAPAPSAIEIITHLVPRSVFEALANNDILQIVVFAAFSGLAIGAVGEKAKPLIRGVEGLVAMMLQITNYVMRFSPLAVFAAVAAAIASKGPGIVVTFGYFIGGFYVSLLLLWSIMLCVAYGMVGRRVADLLRGIRAPFLLAFTTASSEAAFPGTLEGLRRFGVPSRIAGFVLPLGYSFNLDGTMMYCTFAVTFIAQAYGIRLSLEQQITMLLLLMVTSKGMAGVPRASLVVISSTLAYFKIPESGLLLILAVDHFLDMGRSATNVVGNAIAAIAVSKWEGALGSHEDGELAAGHGISTEPKPSEPSWQRSC